MLRFVSCVYLIYAVIFLHDTKADDSVIRNGWRPLTRLEVYGLNNHEVHNQINRLTVTKNNEEFLPHVDIIEVVEPNNVKDFETEDQFLLGDIQSTKKDENIKKIQDMETIMEILDKVESQSRSLRKSKQVMLDDKVLPDDNIKLTNQYNSRDAEIHKDHDDSESTNNYEVTETYNTEDDYEHKKPLVLIESTPNLKSKFVNILSKYNIKSSDNLSNYAISRTFRNNFNMKYGLIIPSFAPYSFIITPDGPSIYQRYNLHNIHTYKPINYSKFNRNQGFTNIFYNNPLVGQYQI